MKPIRAQPDHVVLFVVPRSPAVIVSVAEPVDVRATGEGCHAPGVINLVEPLVDEGMDDRVAPKLVEVGLHRESEVLLNAPAGDPKLPALTQERTEVGLGD